MSRITELRSRVRAIPVGDIWVCPCCALSHANGECCADDQHGGDGIEPWALWDDDRYSITAGLLAEDHDEKCEVRITGNHSAVECDCDRRSFTWSSCDGCGSSLGGSRYAHAAWREPRRFRSGIAA